MAEGEPRAGVSLALLVVDATGRVEHAGSGVADVFGWLPEDLVGRLVHVLLLPEHRERHAGLLRILAAEPPEAWDRRMTGDRVVPARHRSGRRLRVQVTLSPLPGPSPKVLVAATDLGDVLQEADDRSRMRQILDRTEAVVYAKDLEGRFLYVNQRFAELFDVIPEQARGQSNHDLFPSDVADAFVQADQQVAQRGQAVRFEEQAPHEDGLHTYLSLKFPLRDEGGEIEGIAGVSTDITERKRAVQQLQETAAALEEANAELARSNRDLDRFAYVASHDLRSPLRAIANLASWIEEDAGEQLPEGSRADLRTLRTRVERMERLLEDLLAYARAGRGEPLVHEVDLDAVAETVTDLLAPPPGFTVRIDGPLGTVRSAAAPVQQVLLNLVANALKHHDRERGEIVIRAERSEEGLWLHVQDDGPGIEPRFQERVFGMFRTLKPRDEVEGSGMGLALVRKLAELQGGRVELRSEGRGCRFSVLWPPS